MWIQGFEPIDHSPMEFVEFSERLEYAEAHSGNNNANNGTKSKTDSKSGTGAILQPKSSGSEATNKRKKSDDFCMLHQVYRHSTGECKIILEQVKHMRSAWEA
jgi:hypothetical protein